MKPKGEAISLTLALAVALSGCAGSHPEGAAQTAHVGVHYIKAADKNTLRMAFNADVTELVRRGVLKAANVQLVLLEGDQTTYCSTDGTTFTAVGPGPEYCDGKVIVDAAFVNTDLPELAKAAAPNDPKLQQAIVKAGEEYVIGHELGHAVEDAEHASTTETPSVYAQSKEPQADCYSGQTMAITAPSDEFDVALLLRQFPQHDLSHGNPAVRIAAFERGVNGDGCSAQDMVTLRDALDPH